MTKQYVVGFLFAGSISPTVLLLRKKRPAWQAGRLNGPGGKVEPGESFAEAMYREYVEEIGYEVLDWEHFATLRGVDKNSTVYEVAFFRAQIKRYYANDVLGGRDYDETPEWVPAQYLPDDVLPNLRFLIPMAQYPHRADWPYTVIEGQPNHADTTAPDANCITLPDGSCASEKPCMHDPLPDATGTP